MNTDTATTDQHLCPLCGGDNACARAADDNATDCWCSHVTIRRELLDSLPAGEKNRRCICPSCVEKANRLATSA